MRRDGSKWHAENPGRTHRHDLDCIGRHRPKRSFDHTCCVVAHEPLECIWRGVDLSEELLWRIRPKRPQLRDVAWRNAEELDEFRKCHRLA